MNSKNSTTRRGRKPNATAKSTSTSARTKASKTLVSRISDELIDKVYKVMCKNAHKKTGTVVVSRTEMADIMNVHVASVDRAIKALKNDGRIRKNESLYRINA